MVSDSRDLDALGARLRAVRAAAGLTLQDVAGGAGVPEATVRAMESGSHDPELLELIRLARALGVTVDRLIPDDDRPLGG